jgi:hypothetical protein
MSGGSFGSRLFVFTFDGHPADAIPERESDLENLQKYLVMSKLRGWFQHCPRVQGSGKGHSSIYFYERFSGTKAPKYTYVSKVRIHTKKKKKAQWNCASQK